MGLFNKLKGKIDTLVEKLDIPQVESSDISTAGMSTDDLIALAQKRRRASSEKVRNFDNEDKVFFDDLDTGVGGEVVNVQKKLSDVVTENECPENIADSCFEVRIKTFRDYDGESEADERVSEITYLNDLDFGKPKGDLGCFLNYQNYKVFGIDEDGKRRVKFRVGTNENRAIKRVEKEGLHGPFEIEIMEHDSPTERQLACLERNGFICPPGLTKDDASYIIDRIINEDSGVPSSWLVSLAQRLNIEFSVFESSKDLFESVIYASDIRDRLALYIYAVYQNYNNLPFRNMFEDSDISLFYKFADEVVNDSKLIRSLKKRDADDFEKPRKGTDIYKSAIAFLKDNGALN